MARHKIKNQSELWQLPVTSDSSELYVWIS